MAVYGEDLSRSAFTFVPPVTGQMVSLTNSDIDKGVIEGGEEVTDTKDTLSFRNLVSRLMTCYFSSLCEVLLLCVFFRLYH